jgi:hypothetical protein
VRRSGSYIRSKYDRARPERVAGDRGGRSEENGQEEARRMGM